MNDLVLGWNLNAAMAPSFWMSPDAKPGAQSASHLVTVSPKDMAYNAVIVAQSGSGKSFFLGRLLEELVLKTRGRLVVLDPDGDFRRIRDVVPESWWASANYDQERGSGRLPHEASRAEFEPIWKEMNLTVFSGPYSAPQNTSPLRVSWSSFPIAFLAEDLDAIARTQVFHCHQFVKSVAMIESEMAKLGKNAGPSTRAGRQFSLDRTQKLLQRARHEGPRQTLEEEFPPPPGNEASLKISETAKVITRGLIKLMESWRQTRLTRARERAISAVEFISPEIERFYFGRAKEYVAEGIVGDAPNDQSSGMLNTKGSVIDLPSFRDSRTQQLVLSSVVETVWDHARQEWAVAFQKEAEGDQRVPVFIVLEEAHNIVPQEAHSFSAKALREQFRTIAAEGRKYGVFLILCTQRPDKIDQTIVSECENRAVMKVGTKTVLEKTKDLLGLEWIQENQLHKCLEFQTGRFLLVGPWAGGSYRLGYSAMRRTVEGGRNLRESYWAVPEQKPPARTEPPKSKGA